VFDCSREGDVVLLCSSDCDEDDVLESVFSVQQVPEEYTREPHCPIVTTFRSPLTKETGLSA
jgi:hypothetical protein